MGDRSEGPAVDGHPVSGLPASLHESLPQTQRRPSWSANRRELGEVVVRAVMSAAWYSRNPRTRFAVSPRPAPDRYFYQASDGWEAPIWRYPPRLDAPGEPVLLLHGLGLSGVGFDLQEGDSLVDALHEAGFDVYVLEHRGDPGALAPQGASGFDFDDIVEQDLPAAIERIRDISGWPRLLWIGHSMGGQLLYATLARGTDAIAAGISLCAPVRFETPRSHARMAALAASLVPGGWSLPARSLHRALTPLTGEALWGSLGREIEGSLARGMMIHGVEDIAAGLLKQIGRWIASGSLCDRNDRLDYIEAMRAASVPVMVVAAEGDRLCPPAAARPAFEALPEDRRFWLTLSDRWGHLDPLIGERASSELHPRLLAWLSLWRGRCWSEEKLPEARSGG
jgi:predicted alpha/beta hydrolase